MLQSYPGFQFSQKRYEKIAVAFAVTMKHVCTMYIVRGVLGNKCAGQHNLKTVYFREKLASGNFLVWLSGVCVFFCSALSTLGRRWRAFM